MIQQTAIFYPYEVVASCLCNAHKLFSSSQEMLYVVPFVAKVIESSAKSKVFKPPNPWVMAIMSVLVELHQMPDLKVNQRKYICLFPI